MLFILFNLAGDVFTLFKVEGVVLVFITGFAVSVGASSSTYVPALSSDITLCKPAFSSFSCVFSTSSLLSCIVASFATDSQSSVFLLILL